MHEEVEYQRGFLRSVEAKLNNERFVGSAPAPVVEAERNKQADALARIAMLEESMRKLEQESPNLLDLILGHEIDLIIDTPPQGADRSRDGFVIRRNAIETGVTVLTSLDTAAALVASMENKSKAMTLIDIAKVKSL